MKKINVCQTSGRLDGAGVKSKLPLAHESLWLTVFEETGGAVCSGVEVRMPPFRESPVSV